MPKLTFRQAVGVALVYFVMGLGCGMAWAGHFALQGWR